MGDKARVLSGHRRDGESSDVFLGLSIVDLIMSAPSTLTFFRLVDAGRGLTFATVSFLARLLREFMWGAVVSDRLVARGVVVVRPFGLVVLVVSVFLFLVLSKAVPLGDVFNTEDVLGAIRWKVPVLDKDAVGVRPPSIGREIGRVFVVPPNGAIWRLSWDEVDISRGLLGVDRTQDVGDNVEVHCVARHPEEFAFGFGPCP